MPKKPIIQSIFTYPLACLYRFFSIVHKKYLARKATSTTNFTPMIRIGGLRSGGEHKTPIAALIAQHAQQLNYTPAILVFDVYKSGAKNLIPITDQWVHPYASDEALMLRDMQRGDVYATRDRFAAWKELSSYGYDLVISDGGIEDPRLDTAYTICLQTGKLPSHISDLLPAGPFRSFLNDHNHIHELWHSTNTPPTAGILSTSLSTHNQAPINFNSVEASKEAHTILFTSIADTTHLIRSLTTLGYQISFTVALKDHCKSYESKLLKYIKQYPASQFIITQKDQIKLSQLKEHNAIFCTVLTVSIDKDLDDVIVAAKARPFS